MTTEVLTPFGAPSPIELSSDGLYRKQILRFCTINYTDKKGQTREITFDQDYGRDLVQAFKDGAYNQVPFQLADGDNRHNNSPLLTGGEAVALALSRDGSGVDAVLRLNDQGRRVVELNPKLGVSARILENAVLGGKPFRRAVQHVLATVDPQIRDMSPWEKVASVDLSSGTVSEFLDLSNSKYERSAMSGQNADGETVTLELSVAMKERLERILEEDEGLEALAEQLEAAGINLDDVEDGDDDEEDDDEEDDHGETELSTYEDATAIELANARADAHEARILDLSNQLAQGRLQAEVDDLARQGLAPAVIEAAVPLLAVESGAIELSNSTGDSVDPGEAVRDLLHAVIDLANSGQLLIDPDIEQGSLNGNTEPDAETSAMLADWENYG